MSKPEPGDAAQGAPGEVKLSKASVNRFSLYLRRLERFLSDGVQKVSSSQLGEALGFTDAQVRKDLAYLGSLGQPGIGYNVSELIAALRRGLGTDREWLAVVVGVGNLARALLRYKGFGRQGFRFVALFDADREKIGRTIEGLKIHSMEDMAKVVAETGAELAVLAVPIEAAQSAAEHIAAAGLRGMLNFAPTVLKGLPENFRIVNVDLAVQLEQLAFYVHLTDTKERT